jgi:putative ABC transport system permease protein
MNTEDIKYSLQNLIHRKMRSWLTVLSILIGIMAVYALVSFGLGLQNYMNSLADQMGADKLFIFASGTGAPGTDPNFFISKSELDFVSKIKGVDEITPMYAKAAEIVFGKERKYAFLIGLRAEDINFVNEGFGIDIFKGRALKKGDINKVFLGYNYQIENKFFKKAVRLGDKVEINGKEFEVVGFYEEVGNPSDDSQIYITEDAFNVLFPDFKEKYGYILMSAAPGVDPNELADKIKEKLRKFKGQKEGEEDFFVQTMTDVMQVYGTVINVLSGILVLIALISLVVASVNIMNTMYTAVLERTREIGVMKAIGARNGDILLTFIFESGLLGGVGGAIGVLFGFIVAKIAESAAAAAGYSLLKPIFPWYLTLGCILFAFFIGAIAGVLPAINASRQKPVDALRYE